MPTSSKRSSSAEIQLVNQNVLSHMSVVIILQACPLHVVGTMPVCLRWNDKKDPLHLKHSILRINTLIMKCCHHFGGHSWFTAGFLSYKHFLDALHFLGPLLDTGWLSWDAFVWKIYLTLVMFIGCIAFILKGWFWLFSEGITETITHMEKICINLIRFVSVLCENITFFLNYLKIFHSSYSLTVTLQTCLHLANYYGRAFFK